MNLIHAFLYRGRFPRIHHLVDAVFWSTGLAVALLVVCFALLFLVEWICRRR